MTFDEFRDAPAGAKTALLIAQKIRAEIERLGALDRDERSAQPLERQHV